LLDEPVHVIVSRLVGELKLVVEQLRVVDAEASVLAAHAHNLVDHIKSMFRDFLTYILVRNYFTDVFESVLADIDKRFGRTASYVLVLFLLKLFVDKVIRFHDPVKVFLHDVVALGVG